MCGFIGVYDPDGLSSDERELIADASARILHRGPDEQGRLSDHSIEAVFRRLSIIDVADGHQPARSEDGGISVLLNGEIYNHQAIRRDLEKSGHRFRSRSDVEVIPHLIEEDGEVGLSNLEGMYAIAVFDHRKQSLCLARDQFGIKPLFVAANGRRVTFGSELKALLALPWVDKSVSVSRLHAYQQFLFPPGGLTPFEAIDRLPVAQARTYDGDGSRYLDLPCYSRARSVEIVETDIADVEASILQSIERQVVADVPVGISLSGGIDSGLIAAGVRRLGHADIRAFNLCFDHPAAARDSGVAKAIADHCGLEIRVNSVADDDFFDRFVRNIWLLDEPIGDPAYASCLRVSELAAKEVKVLLSGCGGDEVFGGYGHMLQGRMLRLLNNVPFRSLRRGLMRVAGIAESERVLDGLADFNSKPWKCAAEARTIGLEAGDSSRLVDHLCHIASLDSNERRQKKSMRIEMAGYLEGQTLPMIDRATMGLSIEGRVPLLDEFVVAAGFGLKAELQGRDFGNGKPALRKIAEDWLPDEVLSLPKTGFSSPVSRIVMKHLGRLRLILEASPIYPNLDQSGLLSESLGKTEFAKRRWLLIYSSLVLATWYQIFVENDGRDPGAASLETLFEIPSNSFA